MTKPTFTPANAAPAFTPGPWDNPSQSEAGRYITIKAANGRTVARVIWSRASDPHPTDAGDARLIAAAPDLYAALEAALADLEESDRHYKTFSPSVKRVRAALAKARGEG